MLTLLGMTLPALGHALLGLLARSPGTGYTLSRRLRRPIGYFWVSGHSHIYPMLARLEADGLITHTVVDGAGPRETKEYRITHAGRRVLSEWVLTHPPAPVDRDEFMLRIWSGWTADAAQMAELIRTRRVTHQATLAEYEAAADELLAADPSADRDPSRPVFWTLATLRRGISFERHALRWCDDLLDQLAGTPTGAGSAV